MSFIKSRTTAAGVVLLTVGALLTGTTSGAQSQEASGKDLAQQIFDAMLQVPGNQPGHRPVHAKGIVCQGTFTASKDAPSLSKAAHFQGSSIPATMRFSDGS